MNKRSVAGMITSSLFGILFIAIGLINTFWGNDAGFGIFIILLSLAYFPPANTLLKKVTGFSIPVIAKILLAIFILWAAMGVGELPLKVEMMKADLFK